ncbi:MAG: primosomal protein N' [Spirochaetes bacterium]|nr:primosomal protein N' [Spirochaetota bacterium]
MDIPIYVNVYVNYPIDKKLCYLVEKSLSSDNSSLLFKRVIVDFNNKKTLGIIVEENIIPEEKILTKIKKIKKILDKDSIISYNQLEIAKWIKESYFCSIEEALFLFIPKAIKKINVNLDSLILENFSNKKNEINEFEQLKIKLTDEQEDVYREIIKSFEKNKFDFYLLHGVTGSGKTEVYFKLIDYLAKKDFQTVLLIPEISLTPQMISFFYKRLGNIVAVIHSKLKPGEKLYFYEKIKNNEAKVIIGPRSVLFSPFSKLKAIIIDEEHDDSYKSNSKPRYNAKNLAYFISKKYNCVLIFGSATPSLEAYYEAKKNNLKLLTLKKRYNNTPLPEVEIIDLKKENKIGDFYLTEKLIKNIKNTLENNEQIILFINRRGFSSIIFCKECGKTLMCDNCSIPLKYHKNKNKLLCHYCNFEKQNVTNCPYCQSPNISYSGIGTEKVEEIIRNIFSNYRIERFDRDSIKGRTTFKKIIEKFSNKEIDILIGTQMISKGHHFPNVGLVGIINADVFLNFPDFRANEKTFQLLIQVSGRAGRGAKVGKVIIQTLRPEHYAIYFVKKHNFFEFFCQEIKIRYSLRYPPFSRILRIIVRSPIKEKAKKFIDKIALFILQIKENNKYVLNKNNFSLEKVKINSYIDIIGPAPAPIEKIERNFRYHLFIKSNNVDILKNFGNLINEMFKNQDDVFIELDMDPISML